MKKTLSLALAVATMLSSGALFGCATDENRNITASSGLEVYEDWLESKIDDGRKVFIGSADDAASYGIDMSDFQSDGYVIRSMGDETVILGASETGVDKAVHNYAQNASDPTYEKVYNEGYRVKRITLAGRDISEYKIVIPADADECVRFAAENIADYVNKACGAELQITPEDASPSIRFVKDDSGEHGEQGFTISTEEGRVTILHGIYAGALYGTMEFLEAYVGWRFVYTIDGGSDVNIDYLYESEHVEIPVGIKDTQLPSMHYRECYGNKFGNGQQNAAWGYKIKYNGQGSGGGIYGVYNVQRKACHGLGQLEYKDIMDEITEIYQFTNPCFMDENVVDLIRERTLELTQDRVDSGAQIGIDLTCMDIAHPDQSAFCQCKDCLKVMQKEKAVSATILNMANDVARAVDEQFPGMYVSILAYYGASAPPKTMLPEKNVHVSYCFYVDNKSIFGAAHACGAHPFSGDGCRPGEFNNVCAAELEKWCEIATVVSVWVYGEGYMPAFPAPVFLNMRESYRFMAECGVYGLFDLAGVQFFSVLQQYMSQRLMWNSYMSEEEYYGLIEEFLKINFGEEAGDAVYDYLVLWTRSGRNVSCYQMLKAYRHSDKGDLEYYGKYYEDMIKLFDRALDSAETLQQERMIELMSCHMDYFGIYARWEDYYVNGTAEQKAFILDRYRILWEKSVRCGYPGLNYDGINTAFPTEESEMDFTKPPMEYIGY